MLESFLRYLTYEKRYSPHTLTSYRNDLEQLQAFLSQVTDDTRIEHVDPLSLRAWIVSMVEDGLSARTINRKIATLRSFYKFLRKQGVLEKDPTQRLSVMKTPKSLPSFVEEPAMERLFDHQELPEDFHGWRTRLILELLYSTGLRLAEMLSLKDGDVGQGGSTLKVVGKRNKERVIPYPKALQATFSAYLEAKYAHFDEGASHALLVRDDGQPAYPMLIYRTVTQALGQVTTLDKKSPHVLRHTYATHLLNKGADLNAVKELLGHASLAATQVYTHNTLDKLKAVFDQAHPKA